MARAIRTQQSITVSSDKAESSVNDTEVPYDGSSTVPVKYRGSAVDHRDMLVLGKTQVLRRNFRFYTMLGFASTIECSWEFILPLFVFGLTNGGTGLIFWGFIAAALAMSLVYASLAELASISPTAGGQYHWVSELAPPRWQKPLSYVVGWLTTIGWQTYLCGATFINGGIIQGLIALNVDSYTWHNWHGTLLTIGIILAAALFNTFLSTRLPLINGCLFVVHFAGFAAVIATLWSLGSHTSSEVLFEFRNDGGWPSVSLSAMIGMITPLSILVGYDCSVHMSEEIQDASIRLPQALMSSVLFNSLLTFLMVITVIFTVGNVNEVLATSTRQPFIQMFYNITQSHVATSVLTAIIIIMLFGSAVSQVTATSRQLWSFARDHGVPAAAWLSKVTSDRNTPVNAVYVSLLASSLLACINLGSSTALNAIISLGLVSLLTSYFVTICCVIWRRISGPPLPPRRWSLGKFGLIVNIAAAICLMPLWIFMFWPSVTPVTAVTMNWSSAIFGGLIIFASAFYLLRGRHVYCGPVVHVKRTK